MRKMIVLFGRPTGAGVQSEGRQVSLYGQQLHVKQLKWNHGSPARGGGGGEGEKRKSAENGRLGRFTTIRPRQYNRVLRDIAVLRLHYAHTVSSQLRLFTNEAILQN